jgi:hypothetical protein
MKSGHSRSPNFGSLRFNTQRSANTTFRLVENPWTLIGVCSLRERSHEQFKRSAKTPDRFQDVFGYLFRDPSPTMVQKCWRSARTLLDDAELDHLIRHMLAVASSRKKRITKEVVEAANGDGQQAGES